jgi:hypothetical protein
MSAMPEIELERQLAALTNWSGRTPNLWRRALRIAGGRRWWSAVRSSRWVFWGPVVAAAAALAFVIGSLPPGGGVDAAGRVVLDGQAGKYVVGYDLYEGRDVARGVELGRGFGQGEWYFDQAGRPTAPSVGDRVADGQCAGAAYVADGPSGGGSPPGMPAKDVTFGGYAAAGVAKAQVPVAGQAPPASPAATAAPSARGEPVERYVVRKATMELLAADVRAAFAKARSVVSEAHGEYVQESSVTGDERQLQASLTLRVTAERLSDVLNELRTLGKVRAETSGGEDVTTQVVDTEARLNNEQRVEAELLQLMEKRQDAPLKDILELRTAIGNVRQSIEQLTAQRERLGRLVSLASVLVIIRPSDLPPPAQTGLGTYFYHALRNALNRAGLLLADSAAWLVRVLVGGLLWWVLLIVAVLIVRRWWRKRQVQA